MTKISQKRTQSELDMIKYAKPRPRRLAGRVIRDLYTEFGVSGNRASDLAAFYLGTTRKNIQAMMSRTISTDRYEILRIAFINFAIQSAVDTRAEEMKSKQNGSIRADGRRHKDDDYMQLTERKRQHNREYMRKMREKSPSIWRKQKP